MIWGENRGKWKGRQSPGIEPKTPGLCSQCSATELRQSDNHQPSQSSICTAQVGLKCLSWTPGSHSVCAVRTVRGQPEKSLHQERTHAEWFSQSKCLELFTSLYFCLITSKGVHVKLFKLPSGCVDRKVNFHNMGCFQGSWATSFCTHLYWSHSSHLVQNKHKPMLP